MPLWLPSIPPPPGSCALWQSGLSCKYVNEFRRKTFHRLNNDLLRGAHYYYAICHSSQPPHSFRSIEPMPSSSFQTPTIHAYSTQTSHRRLVGVSRCTLGALPPAFVSEVETLTDTASPLCGPLLPAAAWLGAMVCLDADGAVERCPFLHNLSVTQGRAYARSIATNPLLPAHAGRRPILEEETDLLATFRLFHGPGGVVPLARSAHIAASTPNVSAHEAQLSRASNVEPRDSSRAGEEGACNGQAKRGQLLAGAPLATMSLGGMGGMVSTSAARFAAADTQHAWTQLYCFFVTCLCFA